MNKTFVFALGTTIIGFAAGIYAGMWIKRNPPIPPPPAAVFQELRDAPIGSSLPPPAAPAAMDPRNEEAYRQIRAEMEEFRKKTDDIKSSLKAQLEPLLTEEQRERMKKWRERPSVPPPPPGAPGTPNGPPRNSRAFYEGLDSAMSIIMVPNSLERLTDSLKLSPEQRESVRKLLIERREKFLQLVDTTPPPSFKLLKMAPPEAKQPEQKK